MGDGSGGDRFLDRGGSRNLQHDLSLQQWGCAQLYRMRNGAGNAPLQKFSVFIFIRGMSWILRPVRKTFQIFKTFVKNAAKLLKSAVSRRTIKVRKLRYRRQGDHDGGE